MIRLILADDHAIVRSGLIQIFATTTDIVVVSEASQSEEVLEQCRQIPCDVLLLDMTMPGLSGIELIKRLHEENLDLPILILSMHNETQVITRALSAGAAGYITKDSKSELLLSAIRKVAAGGKFIDPALVDKLIFTPQRKDDLPQNALSKRELQVLTMISAGHPLGLIAERLNLSPKTVSTHKNRLMQKLEIDNNADLIRYAMKHELLTPQDFPDS
ncbi:MAG: response regulator transcription factor [Azonexus sp.]|nr:response regulator transcription factor [Azonexus sp.]MDP3636046.1 response regulator transcription factor [Azonexus sp.]MDZ4314525.1 response regulator transcription factor [Azonexus sp.]